MDCTLATFSRADEGYSLDCVKYAQFLLNQFNPAAHLAMDGYFGPQTEGVVKQVQLAHGLTPSGVLTPGVWTFLLPHDAILLTPGTVAVVPAAVQGGKIMLTPTILPATPGFAKVQESELWDTGTEAEMLIDAATADALGLPHGAPVGIVGEGGGVEGYTTSADIILGGVRFNRLVTWAVPRSPFCTLGLAFFLKRSYGFEWIPGPQLLKITT